MDDAPYWKTTPLAAMTDAQWEALCDGCGRCCLVKLEDEDTGEVHFTDVGCVLLDGQSCRCKDYPGRQSKVPDCVKLTPREVNELGWLPPTCAYRLVAQGRDLMWWHPLVSGSPDTVHEAGVSIRDRLSGSEEDIPLSMLPGRIVSWPMRVPKRAKARPQDPQKSQDAPPRRIVEPLKE
jgi:uncharacterized cysteine cluster protein YcgN (CxxCxxCC family)